MLCYPVEMLANFLTPMNPIKRFMTSRNDHRIWWIFFGLWQSAISAGDFAASTGFRWLSTLKLVVEPMRHTKIFCSVWLTFWRLHLLLHRNSDIKERYDSLFAETSSFISFVNVNISDDDFKYLGNIFFLCALLLRSWSWSREKKSAWRMGMSLL